MIIAAFMAVAAFGSDSTAVIQSCMRPLAPLGQMEARAEVAFHLDREGRISPDSIRVLSAAGASDAGVLSYLQRLLPACRIKLGRALSRNTGIWFAQFVDLASPKAPLDSVLRALAAAPAVTHVQTPSAAGSIEPLALADSRVEERPRVLACVRPPRLSQTVSMPASGVNEAAATQSLPSGRVRMRYVVGADGRVQQGSVRVLGIDGADYARQAQTHMGTCRFAPARVGGQPVAVIVESIEAYGGQ